MNKYYAVIQARMGSTRFPGKVMQPIGNYKTVIEFIVERLKISKRINEIVLAIPFTPENDILEQEAKRLNIRWTRGEEEDLVKRVLRYFYSNLDAKIHSHLLNEDFDHKPIMIDITSDCPFVCPYMIDYAIDRFEAYDCDYVSNIITRSWPDGFDFQIYSSNLLYALYYPAIRIAENHLQHTGWNILQYNDLLTLRYGRVLRMLNIGADEFHFHPEWGLTLDTKEDLELITNVHELLTYVRKDSFNDYSAALIIELLHKHGSLLEVNKDVIRKIPGV
jgi:spore coat polysaccharide biosynthesis protein SpsF (cytidylyltransferase family)